MACKCKKEVSHILAHFDMWNISKRCVCWLLYRRFVQVYANKKKSAFFVKTNHLRPKGLSILSLTILFAKSPPFSMATAPTIE